jgi:hypothetical protein
MPTPLEILFDPVSLLSSGFYLVLIVWEAFFPARKLPYIPYWQVKGIFSFFVFFLPVNLFAFILCRMAAVFAAY